MKKDSTNAEVMRHGAAHVQQPRQLRTWLSTVEASAFPSANDTIYPAIRPRQWLLPEQPCMVSGLCLAWAVQASLGTRYSAVIGRLR